MAFRKKQISQLILGLDEMKEDLCKAIYKDLKREHFVSMLYEIYGVALQAKHDLKHFETWAKPQTRDTPLFLAPAKSRVIYQPMGCVCILAAWNFPIVTLLKPLISAIIAGNVALLKPSEMAPNCSASVRKLIETYLDNECFKVVEGGAEISIACSQKKWNKICFTGSSEKGKLVAQAAAKNLVPCLLELGGKCIVIVDESADASFAGGKVIAGRIVNSGQTCICPDYVFIHESKKDEFIESAIKTIKETFPDDNSDDNPCSGVKTNKYYSRMINEFHTQRVLDMIKSSGGKIVCGGNGDIKDKYIEPTIIDSPADDSNVMTEEIFGPVLPVKAYKDFQEVIDHVNNNEKPLAMYYFGSVNGANKDIVEQRMQTGMFCVNDVMVQGVNPDLPFGGVGYAGQGAYHGRDGFVCFSNTKSVMVKPTINIDSANKLVHPPFSDSEKKLLNALMGNPLYQSQAQKVMIVIAVLFVLGILYKLGLL